MSRTIAIFGAGPGLGESLARRFGREGFQVALVARRPEPLKALVAELAAEGITADAFPADLSDPAGVPALVAAIEQRFGNIDVVEYSPVSTDPMTPAMQLDAGALEYWTRLYLLSPVTMVRAVLPGMIQRGHGAILIGHGSSAIRPLPGLSGVGPAMAAMRNYVHALHGEVAAHGVYVGTLAVNAVVIGSAAHQLVTSGTLSWDLPEGFELPTISPDHLADVYWAMAQARDQVERVEPALAAAGG